MKIINKYYAELTGAAVFIIYLFTIAPSVVQIDSGELAAVQCTLGIAHPTGYPLFTLLGYIFNLLPLPFTAIFKANLLAAIWTSAGIIFFVKSSRLITDKILITGKLKPQKSNGKHRREKNSKIIAYGIEENIKIAAAIMGALVLAFSKTFWFQSTSVEIYSLHIFLINLVIYFLLKAFYADDKQGGNINILWYFTALALALSFSNHMTTLLILPGMAYLFFSKEKFNAAGIKLIIKMLLIFFPMLIIIYSYLPIRASQNPLINWGDITSYENFMRHFTGKQYQVWLFSSLTAAKKQLVYFIETLPQEFAIIGLFIAAAGLIFSYKLSKKIFVFLTITFLFSVLYSINYDIIDIDSYFLLAYIALSFFSVFGILGILIFLKNRKFKFELSCTLILSLIIIQAAINFGKVDQSEVYTFEDYTKALLNSTEKNSIILSYQWDYFLSASYYFQYVDNYRKDIKVVDKELLRRSWYYHQMETRSPDIIKDIKPDIKIFLKALQPFERSEKFNPQILEKYYQKILTGLVIDNLDKQNCFIGPELADNEMRNHQFALPAGYNIVPHLFLYKVVKGNNYVTAPEPNFSIRFPRNGNKYTEFIRRIVSSMLLNRAQYEVQYNFTARAKKYIAKALEVSPGLILPRHLRDALKK